VVSVVHYLFSKQKVYFLSTIDDIIPVSIALADGRCVGLDAITFQWMVRPCEDQASFFCEKGELRVLI